MLESSSSNTDPVAIAAETAWLEYAKGTYSNTDKRIFEQGFRDGWGVGRGHLRNQLPQSYATITVSCWLCDGKHFTGVKWCPVPVRL